MGDTIVVALKDGGVETREVLERHGQWVIVKCIPSDGRQWSEAFGYTVSHCDGLALVAGLEREGASRVAIEADRVAPAGTDAREQEQELRAIVVDAIEAFDVLENARADTL